MVSIFYSGFNGFSLLDDDDPKQFQLALSLRQFEAVEERDSGGTDLDGSTGIMLQQVGALLFVRVAPAPPNRLPQSLAPFQARAVLALAQPLHL